MFRILLLTAIPVILMGCNYSSDSRVNKSQHDWSKGAMVSAADPRAVAAGLKVIEAGGHAVDAAIAVHSVLGLVEPQSSGLGGGAFMLVYDASSSKLVVYDGREKAPASTKPDRFMESGKKLGFVEAWQSGLSAGVPGQVALYKEAHNDFGMAEWGSLFQDAISHAEEGWEVSPRFAGVLANDRIRKFTRIDDHPVTSAYFYPGGRPLSAGTTVENPDYAQTLSMIAEHGPKAFYEGALAEKIVATANEAPRPSGMTLDDLKNYKVVVRAPVCGIHGDGIKICSPPPPSSGGIAQNMIFGLYERLNGEEELKESSIRKFVDAQRLTYADRDHYVSDADFIYVPTEELVHPKYLDERVKQVFAPDQKAVPGDPGQVVYGKSVIDMWGRDSTDDKAGTTHISVIDQYGNAVAMTATIESPFGNARMVGGFLLNNELTDFAFVPEKNGKPVANAPAGNKRPRSSMSPTIVFDKNGELLMVTGSPGGNSIIAYVAKTLIGVLKWGLSAQEAANFPNIIARGDVVNVEVDRGIGDRIAKTLADTGYSVRERRGEASGIHLIVVGDDKLDGGADPRREGVALTLQEYKKQKRTSYR